MSKKKIFAIIFALSILISFQVIPAWAQTWPPSPGSLMQDAATAAGYSQATNQTTIGEIVGMVIRTILSLLGVIFISYTVYAGFLWMTAAGNDEKIDQAKKILRNGVIGLIIIFMSAAIYYFIVTAFNFNTSQAGQTGGATGTTQPQ